MSRWRQGWELTKKSWAVLKSHRELMRFPIYGALLAMALVIVLVAPGVYLIDDGQRVIGGLLVALGLYGSSFVSIYFGVALAATADKIFRGEQATIADGFAVARSRIGAIAGWAALAALVGTIISMIQQSGSIGEAIIGSLIGAAWSLITFLAVPVVTFEGTGPFTTLKRSATPVQGPLAGPGDRQRRDRRHRLLRRDPPRDRPDRRRRLPLEHRRRRRPCRRRDPRDRRRAAPGRLRVDHPGAQGHLRRRALSLRRRRASSPRASAPTDLNSAVKVKS